MRTRRSFTSDGFLVCPTSSLSTIASTLSSARVSATARLPHFDTYYPAQVMSHRAVTLLRARCGNGTSLTRATMVRERHGPPASFTTEQAVQSTRPGAPIHEILLPIPRPTA